jgi:hypothetical protein
VECELEHVEASRLRAHGEIVSVVYVIFERPLSPSTLHPTLLL